MRFRHSFNFELNDTCMTHNDEPSMTVPDESLTVQQLYQRYSSGIAPAIAHSPYFELDEYSNDFGDPDDPTLDPAFDLVDAENEVNRVRKIRDFKDKKISYVEQVLPLSDDQAKPAKASEEV